MSQLGRFVIGIPCGRYYPAEGPVLTCPALSSTDKAVNGQFYCAVPCLGYSFRTGEDVTTLIVQPCRSPLASLSRVHFVPSNGSSLRHICGTKTWAMAGPNSDGAALVGYSFPSFFIGLVLLYLVVILPPKIFNGWQLLPFPDYEPFRTSPSAWFQTLILPWITLALLYAAFYARLTRNQMLETLGEDYIRTARSKGLPERTVIFKHGLRAGLTPIVTAAGLDFAFLLGGAVIVEQIFALPGLGRMTVDAVDDLDLQLILGTVLVTSVFVLIANLIVDILYAVIDPRVRIDVTEATDAAPYLSVRNLVVEFPTEDGIVRAVDGINFDLNRGQTMAIVGESGSGKSVTSQAILGLINRKAASISGEVLLDGVDLVAESDDALRALRGREMAMIFQDPLSSLHPFYKIGRQLVEAIRVHQDISKADARKQAIGMLEKVGIPGADRRIDDYPHQLSGGMRQRVMIGMALVNSPSLLIADEPTTALDVTVQAQILELIKTLQQEFETALIVITHDLGVVAEVADDIAVMYGGRIVEKGMIDEVYYRPEMPYTLGLLASMPRMDQPRTNPARPDPWTAAFTHQPACWMCVPAPLPLHR